jgi:peptidoglycan/xylan/chitin deacetylase (PgdA/CDA1 family)
MHCRFMAAGILAFLSFSSAAIAGECAGNPDALGTSRVITLDPAEFKRLGTIQYKQSLPLEDHEVVLTFDDGPIPPHTDKVLDELAAECVKATFFVVGEMARAHPASLQRAYREGHTIGTHTEHHAHLNHMPADKAQKEISDGLASAAQALGDKNAVAPFFRFPYFDASGGAEERAEHLGLSIWSADVHGSDWTFITAEKVTALSLSRLEAKKKGILLLHDIHDRTAKALPVLLRELKKRGYRIVHVTPASGAVAKIEDKPDEKTPAKTEQTAVASSDEKTPAKTEQTAAASPDEKTPAKTQHAALVSPEQGSAEKPKQGTSASLDQKSQKSAEGAWRTRIKKRKVTASAKGDPFQNLIQAFWHR